MVTPEAFQISPTPVSIELPEVVTNKTSPMCWEYVEMFRREYEPYGSQLAPKPSDGPGYIGHEFDPATGLNYMQQRYYDPMLGRFISVDPVAADRFTGGNDNRYWYANNNPYKFTDPDGRYGRGEDWKDRDWRIFYRAQQQEARRIERAAARIDRALETGKGMRSVTRAFERAFGKDSATPENMAKISSTLSDMAGALRDDGSQGFVADAKTDLDTLAAAPRGTTTILVNPKHQAFGNPSILRHAAGHESAHNFGLRDQKNPEGEIGYKFGSPEEQAAFRNLPPEQRLIIPDHLMDFVR